MKNDDGRDWGWGPTAPLDISADVTGCPRDLPDWSKPPKIETVELWDDRGAKEAWDVVAAGRSPLNDPDLYVEKNIDWNPRIPAHLLAYFVDGTRYRHHEKPSHPRPGCSVGSGSFGAKK